MPLFAMEASKRHRTHKMRILLVKFILLSILCHGVQGGLRGGTMEKYKVLNHVKTNALGGQSNVRLTEEKIETELNDSDDRDDGDGVGKDSEKIKKKANKNGDNGKKHSKSGNTKTSDNSEVGLTQAPTSAPTQDYNGSDDGSAADDGDDGLYYVPKEKDESSEITEYPSSSPTKVATSSQTDDGVSEELGDDTHYLQTEDTIEEQTEMPTPSPTEGSTANPTNLVTSQPTTKAKSTSPTKSTDSFPITNDVVVPEFDELDSNDDVDDDATTFTIFKTQEPTSNIIEATEGDDGDVTMEKIYAKLSDEETEFLNHYQFIEEEEEAAKISLVYFFITAGLMIFTAYQLSENPDGVYSNVCRLMITVTGCVFKIILLPAKKMGWVRSRSGYAHHLVTTQADFKDPYSRTNPMEII